MASANEDGDVCASASAVESGTVDAAMAAIDESSVPDVATCARLVADFAEITATDEALAQFYLQDREWNLQVAVDDFIKEKAGEERALVTAGASKSFPKKPPPVASPSPLLDTRFAAFDADGGDGDRSSSAHEGGDRSSSASIADGGGATAASRLGSGGGEMMALSTKPPDSFTFITWNIDGLCDKNLKLRTKAVCKHIEESRASIVFLQEIIPKTLSYMKSKLDVSYIFVVGDPTGDEGKEEQSDAADGDHGKYFTVTLLRRLAVYMDSFEVVPFAGSAMCRAMLVVEAHIGAAKLCLINTHLESTKDFAQERTAQLKQALARSLHYRDDATVVLAGDLNLRDKELASVGGLPAGMEDVWIATGSRKECAYTWDLTRNTNLEFPGRFKPRCRFDRVYVRHASPGQIRAAHFGLIGIEKINSTAFFPSDHWGIRCFFEITQE